LNKNKDVIFLRRFLIWDYNTSQLTIFGCEVGWFIHMDEVLATNGGTTTQFETLVSLALNLGFGYWVSSLQ
jgi:hypothetical protein